MSYVDLMGQGRWNARQHRDRGEAEVRRLGVLPDDERILSRRTFALLFALIAPLLPAEHPLRPLLAEMGRIPSLQEMSELGAAAAAFAAGEALVTAGLADAELLARVLDHEEGITVLAEDDQAGQDLLARRAAAREPAPEVISE